MDKIREGKRQHKFISALNGGYLDFSKRSKKNKIRDSSILCRANLSDENIEMGGGSEGEEEIRVPIGRRFKLHGKASDGCNGVDPAPVPRKLRSAMNKRNSESISPPWRDAKKQHRASNGIDSPPQVNCARKSKQNINQRVLGRCRNQVVAITKDEEEVAETLYALASMLPFEKPVKSSLERRTAGAKNSPLRETRASSPTPKEASKEETIELQCVSTGIETTSHLLCKKESLEETEKIEPITQPNVSERPTISGSQKFDLELTSTSQVDLQRISKNDHTQNVQLSDVVNLLNPVEVSSESYSANGSFQPTQPEALPLQKPDNVSRLEVPAAPKQEPPPIKDNNECSARVAFIEEGAQDLRRGFRNGSCDVHGELTWSSSAKAAAAWSDSVTCATRLSSTVDGVTTEKLTPPAVSVGRRPSWKRCTTHVCISRLISSYQSGEKKWWQTPANLSRLNEGAKFSVTSTNKLTGLKNSVDNIISTGTKSLAVERNPHEARIGFLQDNRLLQDRRASAITGNNAKQKQGFDFLSLSAGESNNLRNGLESPGRLCVPYMQSPIQHHSIMPVSLSHTRYSSPYHDQLTTAQQLQLSQYISYPFHEQQLGYPGSAKQQQQQQQQHHMWAAQMAHYWPGIPSSHIPKWQNGKQDSPSIVPPSPSLEFLGAKYSISPSLELLGAKYSVGPQQLYAVSPSSSRGKR
ncbi:uncharacterized protein LOC143886449 isoform X2 [Tasmannia lanceolata]|uniref:uncharacterized protein LOC143886449 isoform X2 n=1 Tax=Tasmannia lanceolata TaxID=3420 RepID=UPI0040641D59